MISLPGGARTPLGNEAARTMNIGDTHALEHEPRVSATSQEISQ